LYVPGGWGIGRSSAGSSTKMPDLILLVDIELISGEREDSSKWNELRLFFVYDNSPRRDVRKHKARLESGTRKPKRAIKSKSSS